MFTAEWPLTGRDEEMRLAVAAVRGSGGAVLAGPAGVGKTRLAREVLAATDKGVSRWAVASAAAQAVPLGAFATFSGAPLTGSVGPSLLARAAAVLGEGAAAIGVDDAHLLDSVSAVLLHQLAANRKVRLVVTVRSGEPAPDAVTALWKDGLLERVDIEPFTLSQTDAVLAAGLGGPVDHITAQRLHTVTRGNVLWLRHLVQGEQAAGRLGRVRGVWHWSGDPQLSPALNALIEASIGRLAPAGAEVLQLLALGEPLPSAVLVALADGAAVEEVLERGLATEEAGTHGPQVRIAHPLYGEAVRAGVSSTRARRLRGVLATALAGADPTPAEILRRALLLAGSDLAPDPAFLLRGATEAAGVVDVSAALLLATAARDGGGGFEAHLLLGLLLSWMTRAEEAELEFATARTLADGDDAKIRVTLARAFNFLADGHAERAVAMLHAERSGLADPARAVDLDAGRAMLTMYDNQLPETQRLCGRVLTGTGMTPMAICFAGFAAAVGAAVQGWGEAAVALADRAYRACASSAETAPLQLNIGYWEATGLALTGELQVARAGISRFDGVAPAQRFMVDIFSVPIDLAAGRIATAAHTCRDSVLYNPSTRSGWTELIHATLCQLYGMAADPAAAQQSWDIVAQYHRDFRLFDPTVLLARAWVFAAQGGLTEAVEQASVAAAAARRSQQWAVESAARHTAVCFGDHTQDARLVELAEQLPGPRPAGAAAHAVALASQSPAGLLAAADLLEDAGLLLLAADAAAQAAVLQRHRNRARESMTAAARAADLARRCEDARTPALIAALTPLPISPREREIASLARLGLTNKEIGERLHLSTRTVEGHIYRACTKLDLPDRAALADLVGKLT